MIALGVGVGVDYSIYLYGHLRKHLESSLPLADGFVQALRQRERRLWIVFTALTMSLGVGTWAFSALKFQANMGVLLAFMFLVNSRPCKITPPPRYAMARTLSAMFALF